MTSQQKDHAELISELEEDARCLERQMQNVGFVANGGINVAKPELLLATYRRSAAALSTLMAERDEARAALERDRSKAVDAVNAITDEITRSSWLMGHGRGSYEWDDERYQHEFSAAMARIDTSSAMLRKIGADWSNCPTTQEEITAARIDWKARAEKAEAALAAETEACAKVADGSFRVFGHRPAPTSDYMAGYEAGCLASADRIRARLSQGSGE